MALLLGLICLLVYNMNLRLISSGDAFPARFIPFGIWRYHTVLLDPILDVQPDCLQKLIEQGVDLVLRWRSDFFLTKTAMEDTCPKE